LPRDFLLPEGGALCLLPPNIVPPVWCPQPVALFPPGGPRCKKRGPRGAKQGGVFPQSSPAVFAPFGQGGPTPFVQKRGALSSPAHTIFAPFFFSPGDLFPGPRGGPGKLSPVPPKIRGNQGPQKPRGLVGGFSPGNGIPPEKFPEGIFPLLPRGFPPGGQLGPPGIPTQGE